MPIVMPMENGTDWLLLEDFVYHLPSGKTIFIPKGFTFDFASTPKIAWLFFPPSTGKHRIPTLIHDWLCASGHQTWKDSADIFNYAMKQYGVPFLARNTIYYAVVFFEPFHKKDAQLAHWKARQKLQFNKHGNSYWDII